MGREVLAETSASHPRGSWPAEELAKEFRDQGLPAEVVMDLKSDSFLVVTPGGES
ncbi:hypothetical protein [Streptomyces sp. NBC_01373]|uniref:hypothetical protein n=1 Tax=Streptomyces sp. NBC_01373 TaxID=2903843 RepID=UPI00225AB6D8|nr:hypothetical protein [Streptomyces sp. NBC_01373]MCX4697017.1 hypothetical protein [Streptomyces sp. NBC_01373]MCX4707058.1 hypothetical protein [Streptomyces sp. NBC_01373]